MKKRIVSVVLTLGLLLSLMPAGVWAAEGDTAETTVTAKDATELREAVNGTADIIQLTEDITFDSVQAGSNAGLVVPKDRIVKIDLNGHNIVGSTPNVILVTGGRLTISDELSRKKSHSPEISETHDSVTYEAGCVECTSKGNAILVKDYFGRVILEHINVKSQNIGIAVIGDTRPLSSGAENDPAYTAAFVNWGYVEAQECAVVVEGRGAQLHTAYGALLSHDNAAIGGNGTNNSKAYYGGTKINVGSTTLIGNIQTNGYVACGIYHPQAGELTLNGTTIYANGGVGILLRGGTLIFERGKVVATKTNRDEGKVGDSKIEVPAGVNVVMDSSAGYYDSKNIRFHLNNKSGYVDNYRPVGLPEDSIDESQFQSGPMCYKIKDEVNKIHDVVFNYNYPDGSYMTATQQVKEGEKPTLFTPTFVGYTFKGWYLDLDYKDEWIDSQNRVGGPIMLYAKWEKTGGNPSITFDARDGHFGDDITSKTKTATTNSDGRLTSMPTPTRDGYTFDGWFTAADTGDKKDETSVFTADTTLYAHWTEKKPDTPNPPDTPTETYYWVYTPGSISGGTYYVRPRSAAEGDRVTIEVNPRSSYELDWLSVINMATGREIRVEQRYSDEYYFYMPDSDVDLDISFASQNGRVSSNVSITTAAQVQAGPNAWYYQDRHIYHVTDGMIPDRTPITRNMLLSVLYNLTDHSSEKGSAIGSETNDAQVWATNHKILPDIYASGLWGPDKSLSREQVAMLMFNYAGYRNRSIAQRTSLTSYTDYSRVRSLARNAMSWTLATGLMTSATYNTLAPQDLFSCGEAGALLYRFGGNR